MCCNITCERVPGSHPPYIFHHCAGREPENKAIGLSQGYRFITMLQTKILILVLILVLRCIGKLQINMNVQYILSLEQVLDAFQLPSLQA